MDSETELQALHHFMLYLFVFFSIEKTIRIIKLDIEHWSFASFSSSSMLVSQFLCKRSVVHSIALCIKLASPFSAFVLGGKEVWRLLATGPGLKRTKLLLAVLCYTGRTLLSVGLSVWYIWLWLCGFFSWKPQLQPWFTKPAESHRAHWFPEQMVCSFDAQLHCLGAKLWVVLQRPELILGNVPPYRVSNSVP